MRKILTVALLSSALAVPALAADLTTNATDATMPAASAKMATAKKADHKITHHHAYKAKKNAQ